jgi:hypothetical protein
LADPRGDRDRPCASSLRGSEREQSARPSSPRTRPAGERAISRHILRVLLDPCHAVPCSCRTFAGSGGARTLFLSPHLRLVVFSPSAQCDAPRKRVVRRSLRCAGVHWAVGRSGHLALVPCETSGKRRQRLRWLNDAFTHRCRRSWYERKSRETAIQASQSFHPHRVVLAVKDRTVAIRRFLSVPIDGAWQIFTFHRQDQVSR